MATMHDFIATNIGELKLHFPVGARPLEKPIPYFKSAQQSLRTLVHYGDPMELVNMVLVPVLMVVKAVLKMQTVTDVLEELEAQEEQKRRAINVSPFTAVLSLVPVAGDVLGSVTTLAATGAFVTVLGSVQSRE